MRILWEMVTQYFMLVAHLWCHKLCGAVATTLRIDHGESELLSKSSFSTSCLTLPRRVEEKVPALACPAGVQHAILHTLPLPVYVVPNLHRTRAVSFQIRAGPGKTYPSPDEFRQRRSWCEPRDGVPGSRGPAGRVRCGHHHHGT